MVILVLLQIGPITGAFNSIGPHRFEAFLAVVEAAVVAEIGPFALRFFRAAMLRAKVAPKTMAVKIQCMTVSFMFMLMLSDHQRV